MAQSPGEPPAERRLARQRTPAWAWGSRRPSWPAPTCTWPSRVPTAIRRPSPTSSASTSRGSRAGSAGTFGRQSRVTFAAAIRL